MSSAARLFLIRSVGGIAVFSPPGCKKQVLGGLGYLKGGGSPAWLERMRASSTRRSGTSAPAMSVRSHGSFRSTVMSQGLWRAVTSLEHLSRLYGSANLTLQQIYQ